MLIAHLVPGYFVAVKSQPQWEPNWNTEQRALLWTAALASTVIPDLDVLYNALFRGFINHSTLWTHSLFLHSSIVIVWWLLRRVGRWSYVQTLAGLVAIGGVSHLVLDAISHGTPLLYPVSLAMFGFLPERVVEGGLWAYLTDPVFLLEPLLLTLMAMHWILNRKLMRQVRLRALIILTTGFGLFSVAFWLSLPALQGLAASL